MPTLAPVLFSLTRMSKYSALKLFISTTATEWCSLSLSGLWLKQVYFLTKSIGKNIVIHIPIFSLEFIMNIRRQVKNYRYTGISGCIDIFWSPRLPVSMMRVTTVKLSGGFFIMPNFWSSSHRIRKLHISYVRFVICHLSSSMVSSEGDQGLWPLPPFWPLCCCSVAT